MTSLLQNPSIPLAFIAGPAILANACAILQNGAALRHSLAVAQWRELNAWQATANPTLPALYADPPRVLQLSQRRIRLQLRQTELLLVAACLFGLTSFLAVISSLAMQAGAGPAIAACVAALLLAGGLGLGLMMSATACFFLESLCARRMLRLHALSAASASATAVTP